MKRAAQIILLCCLIAFPSLVSAQVDTVSTSPSEVESSELKVSKLDVIMILAPSTTHSIGGKTHRLDSLGLEKTKLGTLTDALKAMPSISMKEYTAGGLSTPSFRGTGAAHTQLYWEEIPLNSPMLGQQDLNLGAGGLFNRVEAIYGGAGLRLGTGSLGGAVNLASVPEFRREKEAFRFDQSLQYGSFQSFSGNWGLKLKLKNGLRSQTKVYLKSAENDFPFVNTALLGNPIQRMENAKTKTMGVFEELGFRYKDHGFRGMLWAFKGDRQLSPTMLEAFSDERQDDQSIRSMLEWTFDESRAFRAQFKTQIAFLDETTRYQKPVASIDAPSRFRRFVLQTGFVKSIRMQQGRFDLSSGGLRIMRDQAESNGYLEAVSQWRGTAHLGGILQMRKDARAEILVREAFFGNQFSLPLGYLGVSNRLFGNNSWQLKSNLSHNARFPTLNDRYWNPGGNPDLRPERSLAAETGMWRFRYVNNRSLQYGVNGFVNHVNDWILWLPGQGNIWSPSNVRTVWVKGIEAELKWRRQRGEFFTDLALNYNFSDSRDQDGFLLIYTPRHNAFASLNLGWKDFSFSYYQDWNSRRYTSADNSEYISGFSTGDASLGWGKQFSNFGMNLKAGMRNIANAQFQTVAWRPMPGRSVFLRLDMSFWKERE